MDKRKRVLVVDDERANRELLEAILTGFGHDVDMVNDGNEALARLEPSHDLVLLDVMMSGIDGFEVARRIRLHPTCFQVPICMVTALTGREQRLLAVECGANDFIAKPIDKVELRVRTTSLLRIKEAHDTIRSYQTQLEARNVELAENFRQLEEAVALKDEFVRMASHELRNPLSCIMGFASILQMGQTSGVNTRERTDEILERIVVQSRRMEQTIRSFLHQQIADDHVFKSAPAPIDLGAMARETAERNSGYAEGKEISLVASMPQDLPMAIGDALQIEQVIDNLVGNAIKFCSAGDSVDILVQHIDDHILLEVRDSGPGLSEADIQLLFVKYAKLSSKPTGGEGTSGLGLAICRKMVELNGGEIGARNNDERGATFWFKLPLAGA